MANRDGKLILRTLKNISASIEVDGGGGTKVVTELPDVGEEHTVYELHEDKPDDYPWLLTKIDKSGEYSATNYPIIVVETLEDAQAMENPEHINVVFWVRSESKAYECFVGKGGIWVEFNEVDVVDKVYAGQLGDFAILKDFDYHVTTDTDEEGYTILDGTGHFLDGSEFTYDNEGDAVAPFVLTNATDKKYGLDDNNLVGIIDLTNSTIPIPESCIVTKIDLSLLNGKFAIGIVFAPQPAHTEISYWIYTNNEWVNMDKTGGTLLGGVYTNGDNPSLSADFDIYYNDTKLEINDYATYPTTEYAAPTTYATISGLPKLDSQTNEFKLMVHPNVIVDTSRDRLTISVNGEEQYESNWNEQIPSEISINVSGICQIKIGIGGLPH